MIRSAAVIALVLVIAMAVSALAQEETFSASVVAGDCDSDTVVAPLTDMVLPSGEAIGADGGRTAASSFTTVPVPFEQLTGTSHSIRAAESCAEIGGVLNAAGALLVVLSGPAGDSGIAYFSRMSLIPARPTSPSFSRQQVARPVLPVLGE